MSSSVNSLIIQYCDARDKFMEKEGGNEATQERWDLRGKYVTFAKEQMENPNVSLESIRIDTVNPTIEKLDSKVRELLTGLFNEWDRKIRKNKEVEGLPEVAANKEQLENGIINFAARSALIFLSSACEQQKELRDDIKAQFIESRKTAEDFIETYNVQDKELKKRITNEWGWKKKEGIIQG